MDDDDAASDASIDDEIDRRRAALFKGVNAAHKRGGPAAHRAHPWVGFRYAVRQKQRMGEDETGPLPF